MKTKFFLLGFIAGILLIFFVLGSYKLGEIMGKNEIQPQNTSITTSPTASPFPTKMPTIEKTTKSDVEKQIETAVKLRNYEELTSLMADKVIIRIEATECCQTASPSSAVKNLDYLKPGELWSFDQTSEVAINLSATYPENYSSSFIGISENRYVASFRLDSFNKIEKISIAADYKLLLN